MVERRTVMVDTITWNHIFGTVQKIVVGVYIYVKSHLKFNRMTVRPLIGSLARCLGHQSALPYVKRANL